MEAKLDKLISEFSEFKRQWVDLYRDLKNFDRIMDELNRELGVRRGRQLYEQIDRMEQRDQLREEKVNRIMHDIDRIKRMMEYSDINIKEIMKALALIYRNVDEIEDNLVPYGERKTT